MVTVNGKQVEDAAGKSVLDYLNDQGFPTDYIAVECSGAVISRSEYEQKVIRDGEIIEIVSFVGGG